MRAMILICLAIFISGCAQEAYYADHEYGAASTDAYDQLIVHKDYAYADKEVKDMDGLHAEPIMQMYHDSFGEGFTQENVGEIGDFNQ